VLAGRVQQFCKKVGMNKLFIYHIQYVENVEIWRKEVRMFRTPLLCGFKS
jgi:hypothetical protein